MFSFLDLLVVVVGRTFQFLFTGDTVRHMAERILGVFVHTLVFLLSRSVFFSTCIFIRFKNCLLLRCGTVHCERLGFDFRVWGRQCVLRSSVVVPHFLHVKQGISTIHISLLFDATQVIKLEMRR
jgi:hypothetical protein